MKKLSILIAAALFASSFAHAESISIEQKNILTRQMKEVKQAAKAVSKLLRGKTIKTEQSEAMRNMIAKTAILAASIASIAGIAKYIQYKRTLMPKGPKNQPVNPEGSIKVTIEGSEYSIELPKDEKTPSRIIHKGANCPMVFEIEKRKNGFHLYATGSLNCADMQNKIASQIAQAIRNTGNEVVGYSKTGGTLVPPYLERIVLENQGKSEQEIETILEQKYGKIGSN